MLVSKSFLDACFQFSQKHNLFCCDAILVAVSGGIDSMSLLHVLKCLKERNNGIFPNIYAVHIHHGIRGEDADGDLRLVSDFACSLGVKVFLKYCDIKKIAEKRKIGVEEAGRIERYNAFDKIKNSLEKEYDRVFVSTAHHKNDQAESILMHLFRGSGIDGLSGMKPKSNTLIRPFLFFEKKNIAAYAKENEIPFREDRTNDENVYMRNCWRNVVLPVIEENIGDPVPVLSRLSTLVQMDQDFFEKEVKKIAEPVLIKQAEHSYGIPCSVLLSQHPAMRTRLIRYLYQISYGTLSNLEKKHVDAVLEMLEKNKNGLRNALPEQRIAYMYNQILYMGSLADYMFENTVCYDNGSRKILLLPKANQDSVIPLKEFVQGKFTQIANSYFFMGIFHIENREKVVYNNMTWFCSTEMIQNSVVRTRCPDDVFTRAGSLTKKSLRRLFTDWKIPEAVRDRVMLIASGSEILWIPGLGHAQGFVDDVSEKKYWESKGKNCLLSAGVCRVEIDLKMED